MQKTYVLDTNVLIQAPYALQSFEDNHIVLPLAVLEELDGLKRAEGETGANARQAIRFLEALRLKGSLIEGVCLPGGGSVRTCLRSGLYYRSSRLPGIWKGYLH